MLLSGVTQRMTSSTRPGTSAGSAAAASHWSGCSARIARPRAMAVRVVSAPPAMKSPVSCIIVIGVHVGRRPGGDEVVGGAAAALAGDLLEERVELHDGAHHAHERVLVAGDGVRAHEPLRPGLDVLPAVLREAEEVGREPRRELGGEVVHHLQPALIGDGVDQLVDPGLEEGLVLLHGTGREPPAHQASLLQVLGIVEGDHVRLVERRRSPGRSPREENTALRRSTSRGRHGG